MLLATAAIADTREKRHTGRIDQHGPMHVSNTARYSAIKMRIPDGVASVSKRALLGGWPLVEDSQRSLVGNVPPGGSRYPLLINHRPHAHGPTGKFTNLQSFDVRHFHDRP